MLLEIGIGLGEMSTTDKPAIRAQRTRMHRSQHQMTAAVDKLPLALLIPLDTLDLLGDVLGVHVVHDGSEWSDVIGAGLHAGINTIQQRDVPHSLFGEVSLHIMASHDIVAPQTGQVFGNDHVDLLGFDITNHPLEVRSVKASTAPAVIDIGVIDGQTVLFYKIIQEGFLIGYAFRWPFAFVLL